MISNRQLDINDRGLAENFESEQYVPRVGDEVVAIDGKDPKEVILENVFTFNVGVPELESDVIRATPRVFFDFENPFIQRPRQCTLKNDNDTTTVDLNWEKIPFFFSLETRAV